MYKQLFFLFTIALVFSTCARVGRPTGGDKDRKPPVSISASPDFGTLNFKSDKIKIYFDEYIKFKNLNKQLIVSPPLKYPLDVTPLGSASKYILLKIKDSLQTQTTYTINFGNAIVDNSEGNVLKQFKYVFSTGTFIDSLEVSGVVNEAFAKKTSGSVSVLLYAIDSTYSDSVIYKQKPNYISTIIDTTAFAITNIKKGNYMLIALKDASNNMLFDPKEDKIAFQNIPVSLPGDSIFYALRLFKETPPFSLKKPVEVSKNHSIFPFEGILQDTKITAVFDKNNKVIPFFSYKDRKTDSLHVWYTGIKTDTLQFRVLSKDSIRSFTIKYHSKETDSLQLSKSSQQTLPLRDSLFILSNIPINKVDKKRIHFIDKDSTDIPFSVVLSEIKDKFQLIFEKKHSTRYFVTLYPQAVTDFLGQTNDTLKIAFSTKKPEDYGEIDLQVQLNSNYPAIIELINDRGVLISSSYVKNSKQIKYPLLTTGKYQIRAIIDSNNNKKWDTGNFLQKVQPENVIYYNKEIEVRANWVINEEFIVK